MRRCKKCGVSLSGLEEQLREIIYMANLIKRTILTYRKENGDVVVREILPQSVKDGYLWAYCLVHEELHSFKMSNIIGMEPVLSTSTRSHLVATINEGRM